MNDNVIELDHPDVRVGRLDTIADVRKELGRLYRLARRHVGTDVSATSASKLAFILKAISESILAADMEARLAALEEQTRMRRA